MPDIKKTILCSGLILSGTLASWAIPARQGFRLFEQPDGTTIGVELRGDEFSHCFVSEDGYPLLDVGGELRYASLDEKGNVVASRFAALPQQLRSADHKEFLSRLDSDAVLQRLSDRGAAIRKQAALAASPSKSEGEERLGLFPGTYFPVKGSPKALVILVEYADVKMTHPNAADYFSRLLNEEGFADYEATGSVIDYFRENSSGQFSPEFDLYGPVTLANNRAYYGGNDFYGRDQRPQEMVIEACRMLDGDIDFSNYDCDGDGVIDNVFIFYAGEGESNGVSSETVWPHSYNIANYPGGPYVFDGVKLDRYACSYEWDNDHPDGVGTFIHEFSHVMGLPDLYATVMVNSFTPGPWSVLDYGPYNNEGRTPPLYSVFERHALGWIDPLPIESSIDATLFPISNNQGGIIRTPRPEEYYLVENRQKEGWDAYLPGHGMLIWHIDYDAQTWTANAVNNNYGHQRVDLIEADYEETVSSRAGDSFPGKAGVTAFTDDTRPSMITWEGERLNTPLTEITEREDGAVTFRICDGGSSLLPPASPEFIDGDHQSLTLKWAGDENDDEMILRLFSLGENDELVPVEGCRAIHLPTTGSHTLSGLEPENTYFATLSRRVGWEESSQSEPTELRTSRLPLDQRAVVALPGKDACWYGFTACWEPLEDAESYLLDVYRKWSEGPYEEVCDFADGVKNLPEGWSSSSVSSYANDAYSGKEIPALRLSDNGDYLETPVYEDLVKSFSFWHRGNSTGDDDLLRVEGFDGESWQQLLSSPVEKEKSGATILLDIYRSNNLPPNMMALRISYVKSGAKGSLAIDDVVVCHGDRKSIDEDTRIKDLPAGTGSEFRIEGVRDETDYYYTVTALGKDGLRSLPSNEIMITTPSGLGVKHLSENDGLIQVDGREIIISGADGLKVSVIGMDGKIVYSSVSSALTTVEVLPGVYLVRVGEQVRKVIVK